MLLRCCFIILTYFFDLLYLCPCLNLGLVMSYLCGLFLIFILIFIMINRINLVNGDALVLLLIFLSMLYYFWVTTWMKNVNNFQIAKVSLKVLFSIFLIFCQFLPDVAFKKSVYKRLHASFFL